MGVSNNNIRVMDENEYELQEEKVPNEYTPCISTHSSADRYETSGLKSIHGFDFGIKAKETTEYLGPSASDVKNDRN
jgi:hypothetical protein